MMLFEQKAKVSEKMCHETKNGGASPAIFMV